MAHDIGQGQLTPETFNRSTRSKELTVVTTAYWDLMRIYDTSKPYRQRMALASKKLAEFAPYSPVYPDIVRKAEQFYKNSKNPDIVKLFLRQSRRNRPRCFIATATFYPKSEEVMFLRALRDERLKKSILGRRLIYFYYKLSPQVAKKIDESPKIRAFSQIVLSKIVSFLKKFS